MTTQPSTKRSVLDRFVTLGAAAYAIGLALWLLLRCATGDRLWVVALANAFAPYLFVPLMALVPLAALLPWTQLRRATLMPLALFFVLYGGQLVPRGQADAVSDIEVVTFNVWGGSRSAETVLSVVQVGQPDIIALQELSPRMLDMFVATLGEDYPYRLYHNGKWHHRLGLLSKHPLEPIDVSGWSRDDWRIQAAQVRIGERTIVVYNVHLAVSNALAYRKNGLGLGAQTAASYRGREAQVDALLEQIAGIDGPVIMLGDFNTTETSAAWAMLAPLFDDAHRVAGCGLGHTFPSYGGTWKGLPIPTRALRLDMVLSTPDLVPVECAVLPEFGESDHHPVRAALACR